MRRRSQKTAPTDAQRAASHQMARRFDWRHGLNTPADPGDGKAASGAEVDAAWDAVKAKMGIALSGYRKPTTLRITNDEINRFVFAKLDEMEKDAEG